MSNADRRRASRVALEVPAAVIARSGPIVAEIRDVSISGAKLFVLAKSLDLPTPPDLLEAAMAVRSALPEEFKILLDYEKPTEIERTATMARLVLPSYEPGCIELGCMFDEPLEPNELRRLCGQAAHFGAKDRRAVPRKVETPPAKSLVERAAESDPEPRKKKPAKEGAAAEESGSQKTLRVFITAGDEQQLLCHSLSVDAEGVHIRASDTAIGAQDAAEAALLFTRRYGTDVSLKIMDGVRLLWTGPAEVQGLEICFAKPGDLLITVAYARKLRPAERERLGLKGKKVA